MPSDISTLLNQRGQKVTKEGSEYDIFLPTRRDLEPELVNSLKVVLYNLMRRDSFRRALRDWAYGRIPDENPDPNLPYIESYEKSASDSVAGVASHRRFSIDMRAPSNGILANSSVGSSPRVRADLVCD